MSTISGRPDAGVASEEKSSDDPEVLREQIEETRAELGETVEALAAKVDVKAQVKDKVAAGKERIQEKQLSQRIMERPLPAVVVAGLLLGWLIRRRR